MIQGEAGMSSNNVGYFAAVIFGIVTLYFYALQRFSEPTGNVPQGFARLRLSPSLMTRSDKYSRGLSLYVGVLLGIYLLITVWPRAVAEFVSSFSDTGGSGIGADASRVVDLLVDTEKPTFPLAVALVMTSNAFIQFVSQPELFIRQFCHFIAGIPTDLTFVTQLVLDASAARKISDKDIDTKAAAMGIPNLLLANPTERIRNVWLRTVRFASMLVQIRDVSNGLEAKDWRQHIDYQVYDNIWRIADEKIKVLRSITDRLSRDLTATNVRGGEDRKDEPNDAEEKLLELHEDLATLVATSFATGGTRDLWAAIQAVDLADHKFDSIEAESKAKVKLLSDWETYQSDLSYFGKVLCAFIVCGGIAAWIAQPLMEWSWGRVWINRVFFDGAPQKEAELVRQFVLVRQPFAGAWQAMLAFVTASAASGIAFVTAWRNRATLIATRNYNTTLYNEGAPAVGSYVELFITALKASIIVILLLGLIGVLGIIGNTFGVAGFAQTFVDGCANLRTESGQQVGPFSIELQGTSALAAIVTFGALVAITVSAVPAAMAAVAGILVADSCDRLLGGKKQFWSIRTRFCISMLIILILMSVVTQKGAEAIFQIASQQAISQLYLSLGTASIGRSGEVEETSDEEESKQENFPYLQPTANNCKAVSGYLQKPNARNAYSWIISNPKTVKLAFDNPNKSVIEGREIELLKELEKNWDLVRIVGVNARHVLTAFLVGLMFLLIGVMVRRRTSRTEA